MLEIYSTENLLKDVKNEIIKEGIFPGKDEVYISSKIKEIFIRIINNFIKNGFKDDNGMNIKNLEGNIYELRSKLSDKKLLRIIFYYEKERIILSTGYIIKDDKGEYKKQEKNYIENLYNKEIKNAYIIYEDFKINKQNNNKYIKLNSYFN